MLTTPGHSYNLSDARRLYTLARSDGGVSSCCTTAYANPVVSGVGCGEQRPWSHGVGGWGGGVGE